jgi:O-antigen ligase
VLKTSEIRVEKENRYLVYFINAYAVLVTLEHILEELYGVVTILKPYRVVGLLIIGAVIILKGRFIFFHENRRDRFLTATILYGGILTFAYFLTGRNINLGGFLNFYLQVLFNLLIFLSIKQVKFTYQNLVTLLKFYTIGIFINSVVMIQAYYFTDTAERVSGFMDNPNSGSFSIIVSILFLIFLLRNNNFSMFKLSTYLYVVLITLFSLAVFASGSRTGVLLLGASIVLFFGIMANAATYLRLSILVIIIYAGFQSYTTWNETSVDRFSSRISSSRFFYKMKSEEDDMRYYLWKGGYDAFLDSGFLGIGIGQFSSNIYYFGKYMSPYLPHYVQKRVSAGKGGLGLHNMYMDVLVEGGIISLVLMLVYFYKVIALRLRELKLVVARSVNAYLLVVAILILLTSLTGYGLLSGAFWFAIYICSQSYLIQIPRKQAAVYKTSSNQSL